MFVRSRRPQRSLTYVTQWHAEHPGEPLKEYGIAIGVYDKPSSFDPQADPIIRVESSRLRSRNIRKLRLTENTGDAGYPHLPLSDWFDLRPV